jgi:hypothetical protein
MTELEDLPPALVAQVMRGFTAPARRAREARLTQRFEQQVDPDGELPADERTRRIAQARTEYYANLGRRSGEARRARRTSAGGAS